MRKSLAAALRSRMLADFAHDFILTLSVAKCAGADGKNSVRSKSP